MGGFTEIFLRNKSEENIAKQNQRLKEFGVAKRYSFYSMKDIEFEYAAFKQHKGEFRPDLFPRDKIHSLDDFMLYWSPKALGSCFVPNLGTLTFDCYFGRTSKRAMRNLGRYLTDIDTVPEIERASGSFETFMERGMTKIERQIIAESKIRY